MVPLTFYYGIPLTTDDQISTFPYLYFHLTIIISVMQKLLAHKFIKARKGKVHYVTRTLCSLAYLNTHQTWVILADQWWICPMSLTANRTRNSTCNLHHILYDANVFKYSHSKSLVYLQSNTWHNTYNITIDI